MTKLELINKIIQKKEFSQLPEKDVEMAFGHFEKRQVSDEEKIRLTRDLLHKVFGAFTSRKILSPKNKDVGWILRKHLSTRERISYYSELYKRLLGDFKGIVFDLGTGVNGFSYHYFSEKLKYIGVEAVGQLVELNNTYFEKNKINGKVIHLSLFGLERLKEIITKEKGKKIVFLFKTLDSLEMLERDYSKKLLREITSLVEKVVVSFATRSMISRKEFKAKRNWILDFIRENFHVLDDFEIEGERYICFRKK